jgi:hypothetical protein
MKPPRLRYRLLSLPDLPACTEVLPPWLALPTPLHAQLPALWSGMLDHVAVLAGVVEDLNQTAGQRIQGFGFTVILPGAWADRVSGQPSPLLHYAQRNMDLSDPYCHSLLHEALQMFRIIHSGYRIRHFYQEGLQADTPFLQDMGFVCQHTYGGDAALTEVPPDLRPQLWGLTREQAQNQLPGSAVRLIFDHHPPLFRFSPSQRRMLSLALFDDSDETLMQRLDVSVHGLKKLWRGIYERIEDHAPGFFGDEALDDEGKRGPEKRRQVLAYVRQRPEEARPWRDA